jgi:hypothetical protein
MYERDLEQAYERLLDAYRVMLAAGGPARCNGEWAKWAGVRAQVQSLEERCTYEWNRLDHGGSGIRDDGVPYVGADVRILDA